MNKIKYIELKTGFSDNGPAWIAEVNFSKSGQTVYFNNSALKKLKTPRVGANHYDIETGEEFWISGIKKNGQDRHWAGGRKVLIEEAIINDYLELVDFSILDKSYFEIIIINRDFDISRFNEIENQSGELKPSQSYRQWYWDNNRRTLIKE